MALLTKISNRVSGTLLPRTSTSLPYPSVELINITTKQYIKNASINFICNSRGSLIRFKVEITINDVPVSFMITGEDTNYRTIVDGNVDSSDGCISGFVNYKKSGQCVIIEIKDIIATNFKVVITNQSYESTSYSVNYSVGVCSLLEVE